MPLVPVKPPWLQIRLPSSVQRVMTLVRIGAPVDHASPSPSKKN
jgi:hypothetical protein